MRHRYIMVCLLLTATVILGVMCYGSYRYAEKVTEEKIQQRKNPSYQTEQTSGGTEQKISSDTKFIVENYDEDSEESVREERTMPSEYAGMTRAELEEYLKNYMKDMSEEDLEKGLVDMNLISFSKEELVIQKIYQKETGYVLRLVDEEVAVFEKGNEDEYEKTGIVQESLTEDEVQALQEGYSVETERELYSILENFSS